MDNLNPTIAQIEQLIPDGYRVACDLMGEDWCHPVQLRQIRDMTNIVVARKSPETHPSEHEANMWLDDADGNTFRRWMVLVTPWIIMLDDWEGTAGAYSHLVGAVLDNLHRNWYYFDAPMIVWREFNDEAHLL